MDDQREGSLPASRISPPLSTAVPEQTSPVEPIPASGPATTPEPIAPESTSTPELIAPEPSRTAEPTTGEPTTTPEPFAAEPTSTPESTTVFQATAAADPTDGSPPLAPVTRAAPARAPARRRLRSTGPTATPSAGARTVGRAIADALAEAGVRFAFTVPGESFLGLLDGLAAAGVRVVATRHEGGAAFMAEATAQLTGLPTLCLGTRTVGASNLALGIHTARQDSAPMIALVGGVKRPFRGREAFQESDIVRTVGRLAKWAAEADDAAGAVALVGEALRRMSTGRPGPALVVLPEDVLDEKEASTAVPSAARPVVTGADRAEVRAVLKLLAASRRGVILAGSGILRANATTRLVRLAEALEVPVIAAWRRPDVFPNEHRLFLGMTGYAAAPTVLPRMEGADATLVLGCRLSEVASFEYRIPPAGRPWAHVDLEPRTASDGSSPPTLAVATDVGRFLDAAWSDLRGAVLDAENRDHRRAANEADRDEYQEASRVDAAAWDGPGVHPGRTIATLQRVLRSDTVVATDAGNFSGWAARGLRFRRPGTFVGPTSGAMGYGLPAAIAASLARPGRPAIALCGDGGFAMTMSELETAVREGARPVALVFDNQRYGTIRMHQDREGRQAIATDLGPIDFAAVAEACGALGMRIDRDDDLEPALRAALAAQRPAVIHLAVDPAWVSVDSVPSVSARPAVADRTQETTPPAGATETRGEEPPAAAYDGDLTDAMSPGDGMPPEAASEVAGAEPPEAATEAAPVDTPQPSPTPEPPGEPSGEAAPGSLRGAPDGEPGSEDRPEVPV